MDKPLVEKGAPPSEGKAAPPPIAIVSLEDILDPQNKVKTVPETNVDKAQAASAGQELGKAGGGEVKAEKIQVVNSNDKGGKNVTKVESNAEDNDTQSVGESEGSGAGHESNGLSSEIMTRKRAATATTNEGPKPKLVRNDVKGGSKVNSPAPSEGVLDDDGEHDTYCWACHKLDVHIRCKVCPRSYHSKCMQHDSPETKAEDGSCVCPECIVVMKAENVNHRSDAMQLLNMDQLSSMLKYICGRMKGTPGAEAFLKPVSQEDAEDYFEYVKYPMDIAKLETNIKNRQYGSTEAFLADVQWIVHNSIIFNSASSPYSAAAKRLLKVCKQELSEIETCPECYTNAHTKEDWFTEACKRPHILVWAKLKGFPYWPAKAMKVKDEQVDVRFFGQHDRAWVNVKDCYLYSLEQPHAGPKKSAALAVAVEELNQHIAKLKAAFGEITLADGKVVMDATLGVEQIQRMLPKYVPKEPSQLRSSTQVNPKAATGGSGGTKTPVVKMTISSLKTSPTVVSNSAVAESPAKQSDASEGSSSEESEEETIADENAETVSPSDGEEDEMEIGAQDAPAEEESTEEDTKADTEEKPEIEEKKEEKTEKESEKGSESSTVEKEEPERQRVPSGILASALGLRRVVKRPAKTTENVEKSDDDKPVPVIRKSLRRMSNASSTEEKSESGDSTKDKDIGEKQLIRIKSEFQLKNKQSKAQDLMDQISSQAQTKPGYRFNISKDISISAIGAEAEGATEAATQKQPNTGTNVNTNANTVRRIVTTTSNTPARLVRPQGKVIVKSGGPQNTQTTTVKAANQGQVQRVQLVSRNVQGGVRQIRPMGQRTMVTGNQTNMVRPAAAPVKSDPPATTVPSVSTTLQMTTAQSISGAITLPGGTITVTPLAPLIASIPVASNTVPASYSTAPSPVNLNGAVNGLPALVPSKAGQIQQGTAVAVRRTGTVTLPNSVATHMQQCSKGINDLLKTTVEQIAFDILDGGSIAGKVDASVAQKEKEALVVKHAKELADLRHSHEIALRELRVSLENEKRRSIIEAKRQCEQEKVRAVEEAKKKQWCARCQREAQFYCCWNTSYCGYHCQEQHWPQHMNICNQNKGGGGADDAQAQES